MRPTLLPARPPRQLVLCDAAAIVVFALVGMASHHALSATAFARDALPLVAGWFAAALVTRLYRRRRLAPLLLTWVVGVPLGVGIRAVALGRPASGREAAFLVVSLVFTALFVAVARLALSLGRARPLLG